MNLVKAIWRNGQVVLESLPEWPEGRQLIILETSQAEDLGLLDEGPMTPEEIARTLDAMEKVEPFVMTDQERADWEAERRARKEWEKAHFAQHAEKLRGMWQ